jgi:hypothetical protein
MGTIGKTGISLGGGAKLPHTPIEPTLKEATRLTAKEGKTRRRRRGGIRRSTLNRRLWRGDVLAEPTGSTPGDHLPAPVRRGRIGVPRGINRPHRKEMGTVGKPRIFLGRGAKLPHTPIKPALKEATLLTAKEGKTRHRR